MISELGRRGDVRIVGSVFTKESPRDIDIIAIIADDLFTEWFLPPERFREEGKSGNWSPDRHRWSKHCISISRVLESRIGCADHTIDFKILPQTGGKTGIRVE